MGVHSVEDFEAAFKDAYESADSTQVASLYEESAVLVQPGLEQPVVGRAAIAAAASDTFSFLSDIRLTFHEPVMFRVEGDLAWGHGATTTEFTLPDGSRHSADSRSTTVLHRGSDGYWRLVLDHAS